MTPTPETQLSVIIVTRDDFRSIARSTECVADQPEAAQIQLVVVAPAPIEIPRDLRNRFADVATVVVGTIRSRGYAAAAGVAASTSPLVVFVENHAFPQPGWAAALLAAHDGQWVGVGPRIVNENPVSPGSRAIFSYFYAQWSVGEDGMEMEAVPYHATCYEREALVKLQAELGELLTREGELQQELRNNGGRLLFEPAARVRHINPVRLSDALECAFQFGRDFGGGRSEGWPLLRRVIYVAAGWLVPLRNFGRALGKARISTTTTDPNPSRMLMLLITIVEAAGEVTGYVFGTGPSREWINDHEFESEERTA